MNTENGEHSGRPQEVVTDRNIKKIHKMILNDRKLKLNKIADTIKISTEHVHYMIHEYLGMSKLCANWVPRKLTFNQKHRRIDDSEQCLKMIKKDYQKGEKRRKTFAIEEKESAASLIQCTVSKVFELLPHPQYSADLVASDYFLFPDLKRMLAEKKCSSNEDVIAETEAYFESKAKLYYKNVI
ncbi:hypothetical protein GWI33_006453 [Rhynchophorus ferrugineus]|uniref:Histone-lysine N-methyltransferase SETMAR-like protein n=1 Tax=Rhynchophorus ferrugineus TaxID=354439 RepID=A0A834IIQ5_RHYFE|nr:hypothetical protein GWI33_006453 [Rhynchophorus ferrugineus]